ncbi:MAG: DUF4328 domain-containing protein [Bacteroidales bacterium]|nr:DUF4328 domain-containing protein [Bacteroidales bacterium]
MIRDNSAFSVNVLNNNNRAIIVFYIFLVKISYSLPIYFLSFSKENYFWLHGLKTIYSIEYWLETIHFFLLIFCVIFFIRWFFTAYYNLSVLNKLKSKTNPDIAIYSWFIPFYNIYKPFLIMKEIWYKTQELVIEEPANTNNIKSANIIIIWWILFWLNYFNLSISSNIREHFKYSFLFILYACIINLSTLIVTLIMIYKTKNIEKKLYHKYIENLNELPKNE